MVALHKGGSTSNLDGKQEMLFLFTWGTEHTASNISGNIIDPQKQQNQDRKQGVEKGEGGR